MNASPGLCRRDFGAMMDTGRLRRCSVSFCDKITMTENQDLNDRESLNLRFFNACDIEDAELAQELAPHADPWWQPANSLTALWFAAFGGRAEILRVMLAQPQFREAVCDKNSDELLRISAANGTIESVSTLLPFFQNERIDAVATGEKGTRSSGETALIVAAAANPSLVPLLLESGADPLKTDSHGQDALMTMVGPWRHRAFPAEELDLLAKRSDLARRNAQGRNALMIAAESGSTEMLRRLKPLFDASLRDNEGLDAFGIAVEKKQWACVDFLGRDVSLERLSGAFVAAGRDREKMPRAAAAIEAESLRESAFEASGDGSGALSSQSPPNRRAPRSL